jgi:hypothetical protein
MSTIVPWVHDNPSVVSNNSDRESHLKLLMKLRRKPALPPRDGVGQLLFSEKVELSGAFVDVKRLESKAKSLKGATMPDGSIHP